LNHLTVRAFCIQVAAKESSKMANIHCRCFCLRSKMYSCNHWPCVRCLPVMNGLLAAGVRFPRSCALITGSMTNSFSAEEPPAADAAVGRRSVHFQSRHTHYKQLLRRTGSDCLIIISKCWRNLAFARHQRPNLQAKRRAFSFEFQHLNVMQSN
jgi:hypothetical protein